MKHYFDTFSTPCGLFSIAVNEAGAVRATAFGDDRALAKRLGSFHVIRERVAVRRARDQVLAYFAGERRSFDVPLAECGTDFQQRVWAALSSIPYGETRTYGEIAAEVGRPTASRAVGRANATNPICLIVPCHRVIGADGSLTGFAFGEEIKRQLLEHERTSARNSPRTLTSDQLAAAGW
jgi:methylated-DNA-[protein]-cysteine S-methyltransferase